ncbi:MAG TPA: hypothetical protein VJV05_15825 [Pyrinomonadaceae bacterium]|nr:hypothetical protein [Pyrinomonadaceae bacterium]
MDRSEVKKEIAPLDADSQRIAELLGGLKRVEAPSNFEFGVRARIASGTPRQSGSMFPIFKVAAPLALVLVVGMAVLLYGGFLTGDQRIAVVEPPIQGPVEKPNVVQNAEAPAPTVRYFGPQIEEPPVVEPETNPRARNNPSKEIRDRTTENRQRLPAQRDAMAPGAGSVDRTVGEAPVISAPGTGGKISQAEAFEMIGMTGDLSANGWTVRSAKDGTLASRSGIRSGDVVESIDGLSVSGKSTFTSPFTPKTIRIRRDGKVIDLKLTN